MRCGPSSCFVVGGGPPSPALSARYGPRRPMGPLRDPAWEAKLTAFQLFICPAPPVAETLGLRNKSTFAAPFNIASNFALLPDAPCPTRPAFDGPGTGNYDRGIVLVGASGPLCPRSTGVGLSSRFRNPAAGLQSGPASYFSLSSPSAHFLGRHWSPL